MRVGGSFFHSMSVDAELVPGLPSRLLSSTIRAVRILWVESTQGDSDGCRTVLCNNRHLVAGLLAANPVCQATPPADRRTVCSENPVSQAPPSLLPAGLLSDNCVCEATPSAARRTVRSKHRLPSGLSRCLPDCYPQVLETWSGPSKASPGLGQPVT